MEAVASERKRVRPGLGEFFLVSLKLGLVGFGGGLSVLSLIQRAVVQRRGWLTDREFANSAVVAQMLPGGAAANTLAYIGLRFLGVAGAALGYVGFILPGWVAILGLGRVYMRYGSIPHADLLLSGFTAAVVGIVSALTFKMTRTSIARLWQMWVAGGALVLSLIGGASSGEIALLGIAAGLVVDLGISRGRLLRFRVKRREPAPPVALPDEGDPLEHATSDEGSGRRAVMLLLAATVVTQPAFGELLQMAVVFLRTGLGAYGGGFAIIPSLHREVVVAQHWLTERQFADAVAVGKLTPGPVLLMGTFIGYLRSGFTGSLVATVAIFLGPFVLLVLLATWLDRVRSRRWMRAALRGLTPAVVGMMGAAALTLGTAFKSGIGLGMAAAVALTMVRFEVNPVAMLVLGGVLRVAIRYLAGM
jgi:chromate transporter